MDVEYFSLHGYIRKDTRIHPRMYLHTYTHTWIHTYTFRHRTSCRTPAESRQEYLTSKKEYIEPCKAR